MKRIIVFAGLMFGCAGSGLPAVSPEARECAVRQVSIAADRVRLECQGQVEGCQSREDILLELSYGIYLCQENAE